MTRNASVLSVSFLALLLAGAGIAVVQRARRVSAPQREGSILRVDRNGDLQDAIDRARAGDTIVLEAGAVYTGPFTLPVKSGSDFITIQSSRVSDLPEGVRVSPSQTALFAKLQSATNGEPIVKTEAKAHHYKFVGIEFSTANANIKVYDLIRLGDWQSQTTLDQVPRHLVIDRSYIHGFKTQEVQRGISLNSGDTDITNSYISDVHGRGYDTQAICGWNGPGPFKIINNYLEGAGENVMFGGAEATVPNLVPTDITVRNNYFFKPLSWYDKHPSYAGIRWTVKNLFELKNARKVIVDGNIFEGNWTDAQAGRAIAFTPRPSDSGRWAVVEDVVFQNNIVREVGSGVILLGADEPPAPTETRLRRVKVLNNVFEINGPKFGSNGAFATVINKTEDVTIEHNTVIQTGHIVVTDYAPNTRFIYRNNIARHNEYGIFGSGVGIGNAALTRYFPASTVTGNVIVKEVNAPSNAESLYPTGNFFPQSMQAVGFVDYERGDYRLRPGSRFRATATDGTDPGANIDKLPKLTSTK
ncbi:MAG TPA: hypothetical protein VJM12_00105 [Pyrinomonadaceae bacterium]|nr:hypothetical protein [Pyrinomonadaceae bacterium]